MLELAHQLYPTTESEDLHDWMNVDSDDKGYQLLSDEDSIHVSHRDEAIQKDDEEESEETEHAPSSGD